MHVGKAAEDFKAASDELRRPVTLEDIARECGVTVEDLRHAMLVESSDAYVPPPRSWKGDLAYLARRRAAKLEELADELEASAWAPATKEELEEIGSMILTRFEKMEEPTSRPVATDVAREGPQEPPMAAEERQADFERRRIEIERRRADRRKRSEEETARLNEQFLRGLKKAR